METRSDAIHRKMSASTGQLPITGFAHKTGVVCNARVAAVVATLDMTAERRRTASLDCRHDAQLAVAYVAGIGGAPSVPVAAEDIRHLQLRAGHALMRYGGGISSILRASKGLSISRIMFTATRA